MTSSPRPELAAARRSLQTEVEALARIGDVVLPAIGEAVELIRSQPGKVIVSGVGKSGLIGAKVAATLAATGTPSAFLNASEALHGDSGMVGTGDVVVLISNSGTTAEVCQLGGMVTGWGVPVIAMTSVGASPLAQLAHVWLDISVPHEADPLGLVPTTSALVTLAIGDALVAALMTASGFSESDFGRRHPGGALGMQTAGAPAPAGRTS